jgi:hydroxymethylglutaryl-CoA lyase
LFRKGRFCCALTDESSVQGFAQLKLPSVNLFEVGPRDGLQNEKTVLSLEARVELVTKLIDSGVRDIEAGSFVRPDLIPALAETGTLIKQVKNKRKGKFQLWSFVPNQRGFEDALDSGVDGASFFMSVSDTFCQKNVNRDKGTQKKDLEKLLKQANDHKLKSRVYLSTIAFCPYEGVVPEADVQTEVQSLLNMGAAKVVLSDTTGHATPFSLSKLLSDLVSKNNPRLFALHLHDTRGLALANACEGLRWGIDEYDSSLAGLGGCPYAPGASGNLATEDLLYCLHSFGQAKEINMDEIVNAATFVESQIGHRGTSKVLRACGV